jgi:protein-disulfide isomerase
MKTTIRLAILILLLAGSALAQSTKAQALPPDLGTRVEHYLRELFAWSPAYQVDVSKPVASPVRGLYEIHVKVSYQGQSDTGVVYVSEDGHYLLRGELSNLRADPFASVRAHLHLEENPALGPADAPVTVAFFSDFECPHCLEFYRILKKIEPRYPQVRFVFKDFPITPVHPWAMTAALAARCAFVQKPAAFWKFHDALFDNQDQITPDDAWGRMLDFARLAGLDLPAFRACMTSPSAKAAVDANIADGKALGVTSTPTIFVDGRMIVGTNEELLDRFIQYDLQAAARGHARARK